jgi:hypothetical protein
MSDAHLIHTLHQAVAINAKQQENNGFGSKHGMLMSTTLQ